MRDHLKFLRTLAARSTLVFCESLAWPQLIQGHLSSADFLQFDQREYHFVAITRRRRRYVLRVNDMIHGADAPSVKRRICQSAVSEMASARRRWPRTRNFRRVQEVSFRFGEQLPPFLSCQQAAEKQ